MISSNRCPLAMQGKTWPGETSINAFTTQSYNMHLVFLIHSVQCLTIIYGRRWEDVSLQPVNISALKL